MALYTRLVLARVLSFNEREHRARLIKSLARRIAHLSVLFSARFIPSPVIERTRFTDLFHSTVLLRVSNERARATYHAYAWIFSK